MNRVGLAFDLEGTLVDVERAHHLGHLETARELGVCLSFEEAIKLIPSFIGGPDSAVAAEIKKVTGAQESVDEIVARTRRHYTRFRAVMHICPRPGVTRFLSEARRMKMPMAVGSVTSREAGTAILEAAGLLSYFGDRAQVFLEDVANPKPAADVYIETARRMGVPVSRQLVFEDSPVGVAAALAAHSLVIAIPAVPDARVLDQLNRSGVLAVYKDWADLSLDSILSLSGARADLDSP